MRPKRERVISPHPASFLFKHKLCLSGLCPSLFSLPLLSLPSQSAPSITYSLSLFPLITARPFSSSASPTVSITVREKNTPKIVPPSGKYLQLEDKSLLKHVQGILLTQEFLVHSIGQRIRVFMLIFTHHRCRLQQKCQHHFVKTEDFGGSCLLKNL